MNYPNSGPGSHYLLSGNEDLGFFGEVEAHKFIRGDSLAALVGVTTGRPHIVDSPWLKFIRNGVVLFIAKKPIRHSLSWDDLYERDVVYGNQILEFRDYRFKIRLIEGTVENPAMWDNGLNRANYDPEVTHGSEWNDLLYPIHVSTPRSQAILNYIAPSFDLASALPPEAERLVYTRKQIDDGESRFLENYLSEQDLYRLKNSLWEPYQNENLLVSANYGRNSWCQESWGYNDEYRIQRGCDGIDYITARRSWEHSSSYGWRPVLELVERVETGE